MQSYISRRLWEGRNTSSPKDTWEAMTCLAGKNFFGNEGQRRTDALHILYLSIIIINLSLIRFNAVFSVKYREQHSFASLANHIVPSKLWKVDLDRRATR